MSGYDELICYFDHFVWNKVWENMGRPSASVVDYVKESNEKIEHWEMELLTIKDETERSKVRNRISA